MSTQKRGTQKPEKKCFQVRKREKEKRKMVKELVKKDADAGGERKKVIR